MSRRPAIRKASSPTPVPAQPLVAREAAAQPATTAPAAASREVGDLVQSGMEKLQQQFQTILQGDAELGPEQREQMGQFFEQALASAAASSAPLSEEVFDRATWRETVELLRQSGGVAEDEADDLIRCLNDALEPLERRESQLAVEFSRRMAADGEEKAIEWLRAQTDKGSAQQAQRPVALPQDDHPSLRNEVVKSRSRRLRGPPG
ncbi:hypothetical protein QFW77_03290 [Luteimonas sp. RD2P54]|uniref:Uncharacterized protein n=1 Tax=Luteimonas endophytica TaxID=3042023 RepID=A0ABT6J5H3_9GAMM|nr:hypothetical protein [Luteimonas endophytica]MDH5822019.1 hypothetical protein [Luteimonas endophytica]